MTIYALDLFAGCGGLSIGLKQAGVNVLWANEIEPNAATTYKNSHPKTEMYQEDANELLKRLVRGDNGLPKKGDVELIVGGPPCQGFSGYNRHRHQDDPRNSLVETFLDFVNYFEPKYVLLENVPGMLSLNAGSVAQLLIDTFKQLGYNIRLGILQAGNYGLPQNRWRVFIWAAKNRLLCPTFPEPTHKFPKTTVFGVSMFRDCVIKSPKDSENLFWTLHNQVTVGDAIKDLPAIPNGGGEDVMEYGANPQSNYQKQLRGNQIVLYDHVAPCLQTIQLRRCRAIPKKPGAGWLDLPEDLKPKNLLRHGDNRYPNRFGRLHWEGTFNTIVKVPEPYWGRVFHPEQDRVLSVRESARAQGFPDSVRFFGPRTSRFKQVGNAVPPPLAQVIAEEFLETYKQKKTTKRK